jgi:hypothetical protein
MKATYALFVTSGIWLGIRDLIGPLTRRFREQPDLRSPAAHERNLAAVDDLPNYFPAKPKGRPVSFLLENSQAISAKISGDYREYSRLGETRARD